MEENFTFPHISQCIDLKNKIDVKYSYVVDQQPIGRLLFRQFCETAKPEYHRYNIFLDSIERYEIESDENRVELAQTIYNKYLDRESGHVQEQININIECHISSIKCEDCEKSLHGKNKKETSTSDLRITLRIPNMSAHVWSEKHNINSDTKLLKQLENTNELTIWEKIYIQKNRNRVMNFDIPMEGDLVWRFFGQPQDGADIDIQVVQHNAT
ncbi:hypothetical protein L9F63_008989 [Diploptera punctata]|uniref:RGS domain-containing protein n=1 Tax=Diploptera punctata TaxID=6984 RepID=A0AAD7Z453_DIPPU|nr:hypothetical protein L9F63_008989 [Diploptera punctata]